MHCASFRLAWLTTVLDGVLVTTSGVCLPPITPTSELDTSSVCPGSSDNLAYVIIVIWWWWFAQQHQLISISDARSSRACNLRVYVLSVVGVRYQHNRVTFWLMLVTCTSQLLPGQWSSLINDELTDERASERRRKCWKCLHAHTLHKFRLCAAT